MSFKIMQNYVKVKMDEKLASFPLTLCITKIDIVNDVIDFDNTSLSTP